NTGSNAEITTQRMRNANNVKVVGQSTAGILSYGSNYGNRITLPSGRYQYKFTDMNVSRNLPYEGIGVPVDIELEMDSDWLEQALNLVENGTK
ncbi:MAG: hypothetical protein AAF466_14845, partial [Bacteroidota bacterium]